MKSGLVGGGLLALIEGIVFVLSRQSPSQQGYGYMPPPPAEDVIDSDGQKEGWFSNVFKKLQRGGEEEPKAQKEQEQAGWTYDATESKEEDQFADLNYKQPPPFEWSEEKEHD